MIIMKIYLFAFLFLFTQEKDAWQICVGTKVLLRTDDEKPVQTIFLSTSDTSDLIIDYKESPSNIKWKRTFLLRDKNDSLLANYDFNYSKGRFRLPIKSVQQFIKRFGKISLLTEQHPADDQMMIRSKMQTLAYIQPK